MFLATLLLTLAPGAKPVALAPTGDGTRLFAAMSFGTGEKAGPGCVYVWDLEKGALRDVIPDTPGNVRLIRPTADGKRFVLVTGEGPYSSAAAVYDTAGGKKLHALDGLPRWSSATVSPDGRWLAARSFVREPELRVWETATGKRAEGVEKAVGARAGSVAFTADGKLAVASLSAFATFDPATGTAVREWRRGEVKRHAIGDGAGEVAVLPDGKGFVSVAGNGARRQRYDVRVVTEKGGVVLGGTADHAGPLLLSPDGRLLLVSAPTGPRGEAGTFALTLGADGAPEMIDAKDAEEVPLWGRTGDGKRPAWTAWPLGDKKAAGRAAFSPDGKRLFVPGPSGVRVFDTDRRELTATLFAAAPAKGEGPAWSIVTAAGAFRASEGEAGALEKAGKTHDPAKVKAALGVK